MKIEKPSNVRRETGKAIAVAGKAKTGIRDQGRPKQGEKCKMEKAMKPCRAQKQLVPEHENFKEDEI